MAAFSSPPPSLLHLSTIDKMCALLEEDHHHPNPNSGFPQFTPSRKTLNKINPNMDSSVSIVTDQFLTLNPRKRKSSKVANTCGEGKVQKKVIEEDEDKKKKNKDGYIHVRAKRGEATDSHSLAERVRRERISERMRLLQALVPGCDKVTGKALMLDEIINYVQSLQNQVEFLSMKLASVNPMFYDFGMDFDSLSFPNQNISRLGSSSLLDENSPATGNNIVYPDQFLDNSLLYQHSQIFPNNLSQVLWEVDDDQPRQDMMNQSDIINTLFPSH